MYHAHRQLILVSTWLSLAAVASAAYGQTKITIDDFDGPSELRWHGGTTLPNGEKCLSTVESDERGSNVLRAKLRYRGGPIFITKTLADPISLYKCKSVSFWYRLTTAHLSAERALICRLRTSPSAFTDYIVATESTVEANRWQRAELDIRHPKRVRNIYRSYFSTVKWITFRLDGDEDREVDFEFFADDVEVELKEPQLAGYEPEIVEKDLSRGRRDVLIVRNSAASYYNFDGIVRSLPLPTSQRVLKFRGLHFPIYGFPRSREELMRYSLLVFVDVDPYVMPIEHVKWVSDFVASGGGLLVCGGPNTFGHAKDFKKPLTDLLPVEIRQENDLTAVNQTPRFVEPHPITSGIPSGLSKVRKAHLLGVKEHGAVLLGTTPAAPPNWGIYSGGGRDDAEVRLTSDAHTGRRAAELVTRDFYREPKTGKPRWISVALIQGDSNGYSGTGAYPALGNTKYDFSFYMKGDVPNVDVECIGWKTSKAKPKERHYIKTTVAKIKPGPDWRRYEGSFRTEKATRRFVLCFRVKGNPTTLKIGQKIVVDDVVVCESGSSKTVISNGGCEEGRSIPILVAGSFHNGRVAVLNTYPNVGNELKGDFFTGDFYDDLMRQTVRWLLQAEPSIAIRQFLPPPRDMMLGRRAKADIAVDLGRESEAKVVYRVVRDGEEIDRRETAVGREGRPVASFDVRPTTVGDRELIFEIRDGAEKLIASRTCRLTVHPSIEGEIRFLFGKWATVPGRKFRFRIRARQWTQDGFTAPVGQVSARARIVDFADETIKQFPSKQLAADGKALPFAEFSFDVPDLSKGRYRVLAELLDDGRGAATTSREFAVVNRLDLSSFYPIMSIVGRAAGHEEDEEAIRGRVDDLLAHNFNVAAVGGVRAFKPWDDMPHHSALRNYTEAYAQTMDMALIYEYQAYTNIRKDRAVKPCVCSQAYPQALKQYVDPYLAVCSTVPRLISLKILDEPFAGPKMMDFCDDCARVWRERFGTEMPGKFEDIAKGDFAARRNWIDFVRDYVAKGYTIGRDMKVKSGAEWDLLLTFCSPAFGYARDVAKNQEDLLRWAATADRIDFDVYPYFYPVSDKIVLLQAHFCMALMRNVARHLKKPWGFYVELDDRNYPMQINPVEASSECAMTAVAQGADYLNSFINVTFGTGKQARPERWEHLGRTLEQIRLAGALLNAAKKPRAKVALLFPYTHWQMSGDRWAPHHAYQLLLRAFGEADLIHEEAARREGGFRCEALVLLETDYLPDDVARMLADFVKQGGTLVCDRVPKFNENGKQCQLPAELFSAPKFGKGKAVLFPFELDERFKSAVEAEDAKAREALRSRIRRLLFERGLRPRVISADPECEIGYREAKDTIVLVAVNHGAKATETNVTLFDPAFEIGYIVDANGREYSVERSERTAAFSLKLQPRCGLLLFAYPARPSKLRLEVLTPRVKRSEKLRYRVTAADADGAACKGQFVVRPKATDPRGDARSRYAPPMLTDAGTCEAAIPVAVNAPRGKWRIEIPDRFGGRSIAAEFETE